MCCIDELHLEHPVTGACMLGKMLVHEDKPVGRRHADAQDTHRGDAPHAQHHQQEASPAPSASVPTAWLAIERANEVWAVEISYILMARGWVCLTAVLDWASRRVLAHRVSITMDAKHCIEALEEAALRYGGPDHQHRPGRPFTSAKFVNTVAPLPARSRAWAVWLQARKRVRRETVEERKV